MKVFGRVQILEENAMHYELGREIELALSLENDSVLHGVAIFFKRDVQTSSIGPLHTKMTIVLSPFPIASWRRLIRVSVTLSPEAGTLHALIAALNKANIFCRHLEYSNDLDLSGVRLFRGSHDGISPENEGKFRYIVPTALLTLELPSKEADGKPEDQELEKLHQLLNSVVEDSSEPHAPAEAASEARIALEKYLLKAVWKFKKTKLRVDWVSPLVTLNRLGESGFIQSDTQPLARAFAAMEFIVRKNGDSTSINLGPMLRQLSRAKSRPHDVLQELEKKWLACVGHVDSDEKILCVDVYTQPEGPKNGLILVAFEMIVPASGFESFWAEWVLNRVKEGGGTILSAATKVRTTDRFSRIIMVAFFKLNPDRADGGPGDVARVVRCFRELAGDTYEMPKFVEFREMLNLDREILKDKISDYKFMEKAEAVTERMPRFQSLLLIRKIWDPYPESKVRGFHKRFKGNPFDFTRPLNTERYEKLYDSILDDSAVAASHRQEGGTGHREFWEERSGSTRMNLVDRIVERIGAGENISVVGAKRSGKTSILRLVCDRFFRAACEILDSRAGSGAKVEVGRRRIVIPVSVNAATVMPHEIGKIVSAEVRDWADNLENRDGGEGVELADSHSRKIAELIRESFKDSSFSLGSKTVSFRNMNIDDSTMANIINWIDVRRLQETLRDLVVSIRNFEKGSKGLGLALLIVIDEVGDLSGWGKQEFLQALRQAIEDESMAFRVQWMISTSRPISDSPALLPLTNVFKDYDVANLGWIECRMMFGAFSGMDNASFDDLPEINLYKEVNSKGRKKSGSNPDFSVGDMRPFLTFRARTFVRVFTSGLPYLMQVFLYHLYEQATRFGVPVVNRKICSRIMVDMVVPEISDYLEDQWQQVPEAIRTQLTSVLSPFRSTALFVNSLTFDFLSSRNFSPSVLKILTRAGLRGAEGPALAPLVAAWLISLETQRPRRLE